MSFNNNLKYSLGFSNYYDNNYFRYFFNNIILFSFLLLIYSINSSRLIKSLKVEQVPILVNQNIGPISIFANYFLFLFTVYLFFILFLYLLSITLVIFSKFFGSNSDIKIFFEIIHPYIVYFNIYFLIFILFYSGILIFNFIGFILLYLLSILFFYSITKNFSNILGVSRLLFLFLFLMGGTLTFLVWYL